MRKVPPKAIIALKTLIHIVSLGFFALLVIAVSNNTLGGDPVQSIIHFTGISSLNTLLITLLVSPIARWTKQGLLMRVRRLLGLYSFFWALLHLIAFATLDLGLDVSLLASEIVKRPYLTVGAAVWIILFLLAVTSTHAMQRKMGAKWQKLHNWVYLATILAVVHFYWSVKSEVAEPIIYIVIASGILLMRWKGVKKTAFRFYNKYF